MVYVIIVNVTRECDNHIKCLEHLFSSSFYTVEVIDGHRCTEHEMMVQAVKMARRQDDDVLIIQSNSICYKEDIQHDVEQVLEANADIVSLCAYQDDCHRYRHFDDTMFYVDTIASTQALLLKHHVVELFYQELKIHESVAVALDKMIQNNQYKCMVMLPNVIEFDMRLATSNEDYLKLNRCRIIQEEETEATASEIVWVVLIAILLIFLILTIPYFRNRR